MGRKNRSKNGQAMPAKYILFFLLVGVITTAGFQRSPSLSISASQTHVPATYQELIDFPTDRLSELDVARVNLLCAQGLPGGENIDVDSCLRTLDEWAAYCRPQIESNLHQYRENPSKFQNMEGYYRMAMLVTLLKLDLHVHYDDSHPDDEPVNPFFANSDHLFIQGLLSDSRAGTCSAIPVLVTAVGRRLGYPLKLVNARRHTFVRWEDSSYRFNIEATGNGGMVSHPNDYYRTWPAPITDEMIEREGYLKSMNPKEELASFLLTRAVCLSVNGRKSDAKAACDLGLKLTPNSKIFTLN